MEADGRKEGHMIAQCKRRSLVLAGIAALCLAGTRAGAAAESPQDPAPSRDPVLEILVEKGILTREEADRVGAEAEARRGEPPSKKAETVPPTPAPSPASKLSVSGFVDVYTSYNFNRPTIPAGSPARENQFRNFDFEDREFSFNLAEVNVHKDPDPVGLHLTLAAGPTTDWVHGAEPGGAETYKHILQAYGTYAPDPEGTTVDFGKFVTHNGAEVIETKDNWNYSRGLLFAWAIPYYHMGLRTHTPLGEKTYIKGFLLNGWNNVKDNNNGKTLGAQVGWTPNARLSVIQNWTGGPEQANRSGNWRHLFDTIVTYKASDKLSLMLNHDYAWEGQDAAPTARWQGLAGYVRYALNDRQAVVGRLEWFHDKHGLATGTAQTINEGTLTYEHKFGDSLITRWEARHDWSSQPVFLDRAGNAAKRSQSTLLAGAVVLF